MDHQQRQAIRWDSLPAGVLQCISGHLGSSRQLSARQVCKSWRTGMHVGSLTIKVAGITVTPPSSSLAALNAAPTVNLYLDPPITAVADSSDEICSGELCLQCQQMQIVASCLQQLPSLQHLRLRQNSRRQQGETQHFAADCTCRCSCNDDAAQSALNDSGSKRPDQNASEQQHTVQQQMQEQKQPGNVIPQQRQVGHTQLLLQLQRLRSLELCHPCQSSGMPWQDQLLQWLPQLTSLTQLTLHSTCDALIPEPQDSKSRVKPFVQLLAQLPVQLRSLQLLPAATNVKDSGIGSSSKPVLPVEVLQPLSRCWQLQELQMALPFSFTRDHAVLLQQLLSGGQLTALRLPNITWQEVRSSNSRSNRHLMNAAEGLTNSRQLEQQQQSLGPALAATLLACMPTSDSSAAASVSCTRCNSSISAGGPSPTGLMSLQPGAVVPQHVMRAALPCLQQLTSLTLLQLPVDSCSRSSIASLAGLKSLRSMSWTAQQCSAVKLDKQLLGLMTQAWPDLASFTFQGHVRLGWEAGGAQTVSACRTRHDLSSAVSNWQLFSNWGHLKQLALGPPRVRRDDWNDAAAGALLQVLQLPVGLTSLQLTNIPLDSYTAELPCRSTLQELTIHWPWRVNDLTLCALPCLRGCSQLSKLQLIGVTLQPDTLYRVVRQQCQQLQRLLLSYVRCSGSRDAGIELAFGSSRSCSVEEQGGFELAQQQSSLASHLQLTVLQLQCDKSEQLMGLMRVLPGKIVAPTANGEAVGSPAAHCCGSLRMLALQCADITRKEVEQVVAVLAACCSGLSCLSVRLQGCSTHSGREPVVALDQMATALPNVQLEL